jgi:hypothetical protein
LHFLLIIHTGGLLQIKVPCNFIYVYLLANFYIFFLYLVFLSLVVYVCVSMLSSIHTFLC